MLVLFLLLLQPRHTGDAQEGVVRVPVPHQQLLVWRDHLQGRRRQEVREAAGWGCGWGKRQALGTSPHSQEVAVLVPAVEMWLPSLPWESHLGSVSAKPAKLRQSQEMLWSPLPARIFAISVLALLLGTELPPGHTSAPKLTTTEQKVCNKQK